MRPRVLVPVLAVGAAAAAWAGSRVRWRAAAAAAEALGLAPTAEVLSSDAVRLIDFTVARELTSLVLEGEMSGVSLAPAGVRGSPMVPRRLELSVATDTDLTRLLQSWVVAGTLLTAEVHLSEQTPSVCLSDADGNELQVLS